VTVGSGASGPVDRAREALAADALWRARDILADHVESDRDPEALALLGDVLNRMGDLPRAGAAWFAAGVKGPEVDKAVAAWREQAQDDFAEMWSDLPASVRARPRPPRIEALRERAFAADPTLESGVAAGPSAALGEEATASSARSRAVSPARTGDELPTTQEVEEPDDEGGGSGTDAAQVIAWVLAAVFVVLAVVGAVTVLGWVVPGD
jgi:hypothetical protein